MRIVVTGAAGFIGSHLAERLAQLGHSITAIDCFTDYYDRKLKDLNAAELAEVGVKIIDRDLADGKLEDVLGEPDAIVHLAAQPGISATTPFEDYVRNNIWATYELAAAAMHLKNLKLFVNCSTSSVYGLNATESEQAEPRPASHYGVTKLAAEQLLMSYHRDRQMPVCALRLYSVYGPRERPEKLYPQLIRCLATGAGLPLYEGSREHLRSFTYVADIVDGIVAALERPTACIGQIINLGCETEITTEHGITIVERIFGKSVKVDMKPRRSGDQQRTCAKIEKAKRLLDYQPKFSPEQGLELEVEWFMKKLYPTVQWR